MRLSEALFQESFEAGLVQMATTHQVRPDRDDIRFSGRFLIPFRRHQDAGFRLSVLEYEAVRLDALASFESQVEEQLLELAIGWLHGGRMIQ